MSAEATASPKPAGGYAVRKPHGVCDRCGNTIAPGDSYHAALLETPTSLERIDACAACWAKADSAASLLGHWRSIMPAQEARKKQVFVDDEVFCELFERLGNVTEPAKINFRFVLGLILMRKRRLVYESSRSDADRDVWIVRPRGSQHTMEVVNPRLSEQQVAEVGAQLDEILNSD